jgi:uncharacterized damage-inducible protein DinB
MERLEIIEGLKHMPDMVEAEVEGLSDADLTYRPAEGEWSIKEVLGHLRDVSHHWRRRLYMVWSQTDPMFISFDGEALVRDLAYQQADTRKFIAEMRQNTLDTVDLLSHAVDWTRLGQQSGVGRRTLKQFAESLIDHWREHLTQIQALKAARV